LRADGWRSHTPTAIRGNETLPLTKEIHASRGAAADLNHTRTCGFACGSGPRCVLA
jgi:hypothetical protein